MEGKRISFNEVRDNKVKSVALIFLFLVLIGIIGFVLGAVWGNIYVAVGFALIAAIIYSLIAYYSGSDMLLSLSGAKPVTKKDNPYLVNTVEGLAIAAGVPAPKAYIIKDSALNAFATGRDPEHSAIAVTSGLLEKMNRQELEGVLAHEMSHIKNYDIRVSMIAAIMVGIIVLLSDILLRSFLWGGGNRDREGGQGTIIIIVIGIVLAILAPLIAQLIKLAVSRKREYAADAGGAILTRYPQGLANALKKIQNDPDPLVDTANRATAHLYISTPFRKKKGFWVNLFSTHPPLEERIRRLEQM